VRTGRTRSSRPCFRLSSPPSTNFLTVVSPSLVNSLDSSSRGEHHLPSCFSLKRTPQHRRPHAGEPAPPLLMSAAVEAQPASLNPWMCARVTQLRVEPARARNDAPQHDLGPCRRTLRRAPPHSGESAATPACTHSRRSNL
jgi:hypothetical protein